MGEKYLLVIIILMVLMISLKQFSWLSSEMMLKSRSLQKGGDYIGTMKETDGHQDT